MSSRALAGGVDVGTIVAGTYEIVSILGKGGMGSVWEAHHARLPGKRVAIKVLHSSVAEDVDALARFKREAEIACRLGHPNIVEVHDFNKLEDGSPYLILELLEGQSLDARLREGKLDLESCEHILRQIGAALQCAHEQGVVHRDLKPQNIFLVPSPTGVGPEIAKVLDFGISKIRGSQTVKTQESTLLGTPQYMAPEQAVGHHDKVDARTDLFALAAMLYELLSGKAAFAGQNIPEVVYKVVHVEPVPIANLLPNLPADKAAAIHKALSKAQDDRYPTISAFVEAFTGTALPATRVRRSSTPSEFAQAATLDSNKLAIGAAHTMESQSTQMPVASPPPEIASTLESQSTQMPVAVPPPDVAIAATIDSSKIDIVNATGHQDQATGHQDQATGHQDQATGHQDQATGHQDHVGPVHTMLPAPRPAKTLSIRATLFGMAIVAALAALVVALTRSPPEPPQIDQAEEFAAVVERSADPLGDVATAADAEMNAASTGSDAAVVALAESVDAGVADGAGEDSSPRAKDPRDKRSGGKRPQLAPPPPPASKKVEAMLDTARAHLAAGRYTQAITVAQRAYRRESQPFSYAIQVKAYCHLQDLTNARASLRNIPKRQVRQRNQLKAYCSKVGLNLR